MNRIPSIEDCADFLAGNHGPTNSIDRALFLKMNAFELRDRARRDMKALDDYKRNMDKLAADRQRIEKAATRTASKPKPAAPAPAVRPYAKDETDHLVACVRRKYGTAAELAEMRAELETRGVSVNKIGYSISQKKSH